MDKANYKGNGKGRYPLSTEGLEFIQQQIELIYNVAELHGRNYILKGSTAIADGIIVVDGEMMPLKGSQNAYIQVVEEYDTLQADGLTFENARVRRRAEYLGVPTGDGCYAASLFRKLTTIEEMAPHLMPKGAIVMWNGTTPPAGWALCDGNNGRPDLRGRFIVGYNPNDKDYNTIGNLGGEKETWLTAEQSGLPEHTHTVTGPFGETGEKGIKGTNYWLGYPKSFTTSKAKRDAAKPHENRPPYYVLAYIMKVV